ncbi:MAG: ABC transporter substrate-binding protein [Eggerthellaceae bacterium]|nr:ABC transporter substrate-binding protein [Eggerthellaceae bacterium]
MTYKTLSRRGFLGAAGTLVLAGLVGCTSSGGTSSASASASASTASSAGALESLTIYVGAEPESGFDPMTGYGSSGAYTFFHSRLLRFDKDMKLQADVAKDHKISEDGLTYTYMLRDDIMFSDGTPLKASDVVFSYLTARDGASSSLNLTKLADAKAIDDYTVEFTLSEPYSSFEAITGKLCIVPEAGYDAENYRTNPIGSGPFRMVQWDKGQQVIIKPNEKYYGTISPFKQITVLFLDGEAVLANAQSGLLDVAMVSPEYAKETVKGMHLETCATIDTRGFNLPTQPESEVDGKIVGNNVTCDPAIRKALSIGIDRQAIVDNALNGIGTPTPALITQVPWANPDCTFKDGRVDEAIKILEDAGWVAGADGVREKDGIRAEFSITGRTDDLQRYNVAVGFAQEAEKLGIKINATAEEWNKCKEISENTPTCWGTGNYDPAGDLTGYYGTGSSTNHSQYSNPVVDEHIAKAQSAISMDAAIEEWKKVQWDGQAGPESENGDLPNIWLANIDHTYFVRDGLNLGEQLIHPHGHGWPVVCNIEEWKMEG